MPVPLIPPPLSPPYGGLYNFGTLSYFLSQRRIDEHAWLPPAQDGGVVVGPLVICTPVASQYDHTCPGPGLLKSTPIPGVRNAISSDSQWFEVALEESTFSCPDLKELAKQSLLATIEHFVDQAVLSALLAGSVVLAAEPSYQCALSAAVQQAGAVTNSDGRALITLPPSLAAYALGTRFLSVDGGKLVDAFGNWYRVLKGTTDGALWVENEATYEAWLSEVIIDEISVPRDAQRDSNTIIVRAEQGVLLVQDRCDSFQIPFTCAP